MPWSTPTLRDVRSIVRDNIRATLPGADASIPNSVLRVISDAQGGLCHLTMQYVDWLALQLLPDTAETEWLDRHADIWLVNADSTTGRKLATLANGIVTFTGTAGTVVPVGAQLQGATGQLVAGEIAYETTAEITIGEEPTDAPVRALDPGAIGNRETGDTLSLISQVPGADNIATVVVLAGGVDVENDEDLRTRVLARIRQPPMGGDKDDYVQWALAVPGVTRAWSYPLEMGMGTVTVRFMMDELRADQGGFPQAEDIAAVAIYLDQKRPVAVKDCYVEAPIPYPVSVRFTYLDVDAASTRGAIEASLKDAFRERAVPGQQWWRSWTDEAIASAAGVNAYVLVGGDSVMPSGGHLAVLGDIIYDVV